MMNGRMMTTEDGMESSVSLYSQEEESEKSLIVNIN